MVAEDSPLVQQPPEEITSQIVQQGIIQMKKALSQIEGECATMRGDAQSNIFANMVNVCGRLLQQSDALKRANEEYAKVLEKIYQAHPDIKISMGKKADSGPKETIGEKATVKVKTR